MVRFGQVFYHRRDDSSLTAHSFSDEPGWFSTQAGKDILIKEYNAALYSRKFVNRSFKSLEECLQFKYNNQGFLEHANEVQAADSSGARQNHGDMVIADALAWRMARHIWQGIRKAEAETIPVGSLAWRRQLRDTKKRKRA